ncbi:MAG: hypothetical protein U0637_04625 [Phycisphaerales bacterium]
MNRLFHRGLAAIVVLAGLGMVSQAGAAEGHRGGEEGWHGDRGAEADYSALGRGHGRGDRGRRDGHDGRDRRDRGCHKPVIIRPARPVITLRPGIRIVIVGGDRCEPRRDVCR